MSDWPGHETVSPLQGGGIQLKQRGNVIPMGNRNQGESNLLCCLMLSLGEHSIRLILQHKHKDTQRQTNMRAHTEATKITGSCLKALMAQTVQQFINIRTLTIAQKYNSQYYILGKLSPYSSLYNKNKQVGHISVFKLYSKSLRVATSFYYHYWLWTVLHEMIIIIVGGCKKLKITRAGKVHINYQSPNWCLKMVHFVDQSSKNPEC